MNGLGTDRSKGSEEARSGEEQPPSWMSGPNIAMPARVPGHLERGNLTKQAMPTLRRLTVLQAPGGFGKTTLLAECCRRLQESGTRVAWVSCDGRDVPDVLDVHIACACQRAVAGPGTGGFKNTGITPGVNGSRTTLAARAIADLDGPFVLVFDEVERLANPESAALLDMLLQRGPPNLHLAFAGRDFPPGVNVAGAVLDGRAAIFSAEDLRFSRAEVAAFFDGKLSPAQLSAVMTESAGWPLALRVSRNEMASGRRGNTLATQSFVANWVEARLLDGLEAQDREFLLDIGLFEWMDAPLLDEVLERSDSMRMIDTMPGLAGLIEPVEDGVAEVWRLHPLVREHCARLRFRDTPERFRAVHRRIAGALERRGQTVPAMQHALEAGECLIAGEILERAGGVRLHVRIGAAQFLAADRLLSEDVIQGRPRLALVRCLAVMLSGRMQQAGERFRAVAATLDGLGENGSADAVQLAAENCIVRGMIALYGGERSGSASMRALLADVARLAGSPNLDSLTRGVMEYSLCIAGAMSARFPDALSHAVQARRCFAENRYMSMYVDLQEGQVAMAEGRAEDAGALYRRATRYAKSNYALGPEPEATCQILLRELAHECGIASAAPALTRVPEALATGGSPLQAYAAASGTLVETMLRNEGMESALSAAEDMLAYVSATGLPALVRYVSALRISVLASAGRTADGEEAWRAAELPEAPEDCLDLNGQTWREMESISCAWLRLAIGGRRFAEGRGFADDLRAIAAARGLRRTHMRALALSTLLEVRAGETRAAEGHLEAYLRLYAETPYAGPLVRESADCAQLADRWLRGTFEPALEGAARSLLAATQRAEAAGRTELSAREMDVLSRLGTLRDKEIASELGISAYGVRHHIRGLFAKLGARKRGEAVRRARELGLLGGEH